jgi:hypothetical protein
MHGDVETNEEENKQGSESEAYAQQLLRFVIVFWTILFGECCNCFVLFALLQNLEREKDRSYHSSI